MRRFSLYKRGKYFYCRFWNPTTKSYGTGISTRETSKNAAMATVAYWERHGIPEHKQTVEQRVSEHTILSELRNQPIDDHLAEKIVAILMERGIIHSATVTNTFSKQPLLEYLSTFWDYDESPYVKEKLAYGQSIGRRHCYEQTKCLNHWKDYFEDAPIAAVNRESIREFQLHLSDKGLAAKTINGVVSAGTIAFKWMHDRGYIPNNPAAGLRKFSGKTKKKGILTDEEVLGVFSVAWKDERARVGNLLAATTGMRAGEVIALRVEDIEIDVIQIRHSWNFADGLKTPKNGEERVVPLLPFVRKALLALVETNPYGTSGFVFHGTAPDRPMHIDTLGRELARAYVDSKLSNNDRFDETKREEVRLQMIDRRISFHSWRHAFATRIADQVDMRIVQVATGHKDAGMAEYYANHRLPEQLEKVANAVKNAYGPLERIGA